MKISIWILTPKAKKIYSQENWIIDFLEESEDMEAEHKAEVIEEEEESIDYEGGIFVDPLTGEVRKKVITEPREYETEAEEKSETKIDSMAEPATGPDTEHKITSSPGSEDFWYEELDALYRSEEEAAELALKKVEEESNVEAMFVDKVEEPVLITAQFDFEAWQKIEETRIIEESMGEFLVDVIKMAIESSERNNAINQLYNNLNKKKLMKELFKLRSEQEHENWLRTQLNRKCVEHYNRKKLYRTITEESTKVADYYNQKLYEQMIRLDNLLSEEETVKAKTENLILQLKKELEDLKALNQNELENFENMILHNIIRGDCNHLRNSMRGPMNNMARERKNISLLHRKIIAKQQIILSIKKKIADAENLGDGLNISDYRSIQHDISVLHGKIQEREKDLVKMRNTLNKDIGQITHMRKKRSILVQQTAMQREALKEFCEKRDLVRVKLDSLTHKRMRLRQQIRNATLQSGLLSKPLLITDHEDAKKRVEALNETIENLRNKYELLEWRVQQLNKQLGPFTMEIPLQVALRICPILPQEKPNTVLNVDEAKNAGMQEDTAFLPKSDDDAPEEEKEKKCCAKAINSLSSDTSAEITTRIWLS
ncbi:coiled-coil domain-containing protein 96 [Glossina fuscipes]|uniref:Coiled-coil domain-containing protein 96 n=1 Tax=Glossina fuscipes TaxID=7396 RepID=A0A9C5ZEE1_9MUSC|nr:coiled-coil domain-containing protein 96 [Glossina fuscipes]